MYKAIKRRNYILNLTLSAAVITVFLILGSILFDIIANGISVIDWNFITENPIASGRKGGIFPIIISTFLVIVLALFIAIPIGLGTAILLAEFTLKEDFLGKMIRRSLDVLAGVPSIVFGLFGNAFFSVFLGLGFSILSGSLTLACMILPLFIRNSENSLRMVPKQFKDAAAGLGFSKTASLRMIILPAAIPGILSGGILAFGRAIAETAALVFTSGYVDRMPENLMDSGRTLSVHIYDLAMNVPGGDAAAYGSSLILIFIIVSISIVVSLISKLYEKRGEVIV